MKPKELSEITRQAWLVTEFSKTTTMQNIATAVAKGEILIDRGQLPRLLSLIQSSIESGFITSVGEFETQVKVIINDHSKKN